MNHMIDNELNTGKDTEHMNRIDEKLLCEVTGGDLADIPLLEGRASANRFRYQSDRVFRWRTLSDRNGKSLL